MDQMKTDVQTEDEEHQAPEEKEKTVDVTAKKLARTPEFGDSLSGDFGPIQRVIISEETPLVEWSNIYPGILVNSLLGVRQVTVKIYDITEARKVKRDFMVPRHPNIIERIGTDILEFRGEPHIYIAMEECHRRNLQDYVETQIKAGVPFNPDKYLSYSYQLALGVEFLHDHDIIAGIGALEPCDILLSTDKKLIKIGKSGYRSDCTLQQFDIESLGDTFFYLWSYGKRYPSLLLPNAHPAKSLLTLMMSDINKEIPTASEIVRHEVFRSLRGFKDVMTSTEDMLTKIDAATDPMEAYVYTDGVTTKFGNLTGGLAISKSVSKNVGSDGGSIVVGGCAIVFPPDSFVEPSLVTVMAEVDSTKWPRNFIGFTPALHVHAPTLRRKARVKLPSWCISNQPGKSEAHIFHIPNGGTEWEDTGVTLPITSEPYFEFEWQDFSPVFIGSWFGSNTPVEYRVAGSVYVSDAAEVSVAFHINDQETPTSDSLVSEAILKRMSFARPPKHFKIGIDQFTTKQDETIETYIKCKDPVELEFNPTDPFLFIANKNFATKLSVEHHGAVLGNLNESQRIYLQCEVRRKSGEKIGNTALFASEWTPRKKKAIKRKRAGKSSSGAEGGININYKVDKRRHREKRVTAQNFADHGANMANAQTGTKFRLAGRIDSSGHVDSDDSEADDEMENTDSES